MNIKLTLIILLLSISGGYAQKLTDCSACSVKAYKEVDLAENKLYEIELLRNEIFARHGYKFQNERLEEYFKQFGWYRSSATKTFSAAELNSNETHNIELFKKLESKIKAERDQMLAELQRLKTAVLTDNHAVVREFVADPDQYESALAVLKEILGSIPVSDISWFKDQALYAITTDNGLYRERKEIRINGNFISIMMHSPWGHSELMESNDAFSYPSQFYSEEEYSYGGHLEFKGGKLKFIRTVAAG
ncbi:hypothetical protein GCM10009122_61200 [Fulvivirga kasyanovii]|uniref:YARHG domain-containing protein n=1 Tax=Fulvivirga kasyanovii TaxID=396812 RepID=A0ABW9RQU9_9BACT|nr:YARHG domain-containing protein [Fulvivirga kasyanovii]MTI26260.1 YARHG domain-containing protein [Fulvivirga kasyanovii]